MTRPLAPVAFSTLPDETDARSIRLGSFAHLGGIALFPPALVIWLSARSRVGTGRSVPGVSRSARFVEGESKEALNWQITFLLLLLIVGTVVGVVQTVLWFTPLASLGAALNLVPWLLYGVNVALSVAAFRTARSGAIYRYPVSLRLVK